MALSSSPLSVSWNFLHALETVLGETTNLLTMAYRCTILVELDCLCNVCRAQVSHHATGRDTDPSQM